MSTTTDYPRERKAWRYALTGQPKDVLKLETLPVPPLGDDSVLVRKFMTLLPRFLARLPKIPGADLAGIVEVSTSSLFSPGDTVTGIHREGRKGSLSTHIVASPSELARVSAGKDAKVSFAQAAGLPIVGITAWNLAREVKEGDRVFVNGGSTGVGLILTQLCRHRGASFVAASASGEKCNIVKERGVDEVIDYRTNDLPTALKEKFGQTPFDVILDCVDTIPLYRACPGFLSAKGAYLNIGASIPAGPGSGRGALRFLYERFAIMLWPAWLGGTPRPHKNITGDNSQGQLKEVAKLLDSGVITSLVDSTWAFKDAPKAFEKLMTNRATGKVVVLVHPQEA